MKRKKTSMQPAKEYIRKKPMPDSLKTEFVNHGMEHLLEGVYRRTAELIEDNADAGEALKMHLKQILPCIAFYEALLKQEGSQEKALSVYGSWCSFSANQTTSVMETCIRSLYGAERKRLDAAETAVILNCT